MNTDPLHPPQDFEDLARGYDKERPQPIRDIERAVFGVECGVESYTTSEQADLLVSQLTLTPTSMVLDVGAGRGWPGLRAVESTGCRLYSSDIPVAALTGAKSNLETMFPNRTPLVIGSEGGALPFRRGVLDAVIHSDVLC